MSTSYTTNISVSGQPGMSGQDVEVGNSAIIIGPALGFAANSNSVSIGSFAFNTSGTGVIQELFLVATGPCTINTNNASSPTNSITLVANIPMFWGRSSGYFANPLNANTNAAFLSCNAAVLLSGFILTT
jgi:hypothetical protein